MLTDAKIQGLQAVPRKVIEVADEGKGAVIGLRVRVGSGGSKSFLLRTRVGSKVKVVTLGRYGPRMGLAAARKAARQVIADFEAGRDPTADYKAGGSAKRDTVDGLYRQWCLQHVDRLRSAREVRRIFTAYVLPALGERMADAIERKDIVRLIDAVVYADPARPTPPMGRAVLAQLSSFFGWLEGRDVIGSNPCRGMAKPAAGKPRDRVLSDSEIKALWDSASSEGWPFGDAVKLLLLTAARRSEVFEARWAEFDMQSRLWSLPAERAKNGQAHDIPLSDAAAAILEAMPRLDASDLLFPARGAPQRAASGVSKLKARLDGAIGSSDWVLHDIRRTVATNMQKLGIRLEVVEALLNHISGSRAGIVGVYQRYGYEAEKRTAMDAWAGRLAEIIDGRTATGNVVRLDARA